MNVYRAVLPAFKDISRYCRLIKLGLRRDGLPNWILSVDFPWRLFTLLVWVALELLISILEVWLLLLNLSDRRVIYGIVTIKYRGACLHVIVTISERILFATTVVHRIISAMWHRWQLIIYPLRAIVSESAMRPRLTLILLARLLLLAQLPLKIHNLLLKSSHL